MRKADRPCHPDHLRACGYAYMDSRGERYRHHLHGYCAGICALEDRQQDLHSTEREVGRCYFDESRGSFCGGLHRQVNHSCFVISCNASLNMI